MASIPESTGSNRNSSQTDIGNVNFGNVQVGTISGLKFNDLNANGILDAGEPTLPNWQIFLDLNNNGRPDSNEPLTSTNAQGNYFFVNLPPGNYLVREVQQPNFRQTTPNPGSITIVSGTNATGINFGNNFFAGTISGLKFNDINANAQLDPGEPTLSNWQIYLDLNGNSRLDSNEPSTLTNAQGNYAFVNIPVGNYTVREVQQPNFRRTTPNPGTINLTPGAVINNVNFGNIFFTGSISGIKFNDLNANGFRDATDPALANWQIYIDLNNNGRLDSGEPTTFTNPQGNYTFANVVPGNYFVREVLQPGWVQTTPNPGPIAITGGTNAAGINFGNNLPTGSISGFKFNDLNGNGVNEPNEPRVANWPIYLDLNNNSQRDSNEPLNLTNAQGNFSFINLPQGTYLVREVQQPGFRQTTPNPSPIIVGNGTNATNISFGNSLVLGNISGVKFNDLNANGRLDPGEPPIANTQIYIDLNNNSSLDTTEPSTVSDGQGNYSFRNVPVGTYVLREIAPPGFIQTTSPAVVTISAGTSARSLDLITGDENQLAKESLNDPLTNSSKSGKESLIGEVKPDKFLLGATDTNAILNFGESKDLVSLTNDLSFGQLNIFQEIKDNSLPSDELIVSGSGGSGIAIEAHPFGLF
ncbi:collagen-binding protein [Oscillatoriales cyanobacterium USR001]|nr:collagen-binding protein [Oscillatoriales cyanobacterium USR001]